MTVATNLRERHVPAPTIAGSASPALRACQDSSRLVAIKVLHTTVWATVEISMIYLLVAGLIGRTDRRAGVAAGIVAGESLVFAANGFRCPLTAVAESLAADDGSVTDIYLPRWFARSLPVLHVPLIAAAVFLHARNLRTARSGSDRVFP